MASNSKPAASAIAEVVPNLTDNGGHVLPSQHAADEAEFERHFGFAVRYRKLEDERAALAEQRPLSIAEHKTEREELEHIERALRAIEPEEASAMPAVPAPVSGGA